MCWEVDNRRLQKALYVLNASGTHHSDIAASNARFQLIIFRSLAFDRKDRFRYIRSACAFGLFRLMWYVANHKPLMPLSINFTSGRVRYSTACFVFLLYIRYARSSDAVREAQFIYNEHHLSCRHEEDAMPQTRKQARGSESPTRGENRPAKAWACLPPVTCPQVSASSYDSIAYNSKTPSYSSNQVRLLSSLRVLRAFE